MSTLAALDFKLILITPDADAAGIESATARALCVDHPERVAVQLRSKHLDAPTRDDLGKALRSLTRNRGASLIVNGDVALAVRLDADGLQVPESGPRPDTLRAHWGRRLIGASCHDANGLDRAGDADADFALLSPVYDVAGKAPALGIRAFAALVAHAPLPVFALGGVTVDAAAALISHGAEGLAVMRAVYAARDPADAVRALLRCVEQARTTLTRTPHSGEP